MITEDYVNFKIAKLLKEKGFDEMCQKVYMHNGQLLWAQIFMEGESFVNNKHIELVANYNDWANTQGEYAYLCPTLQRVKKWLNEKYGIFIQVCLIPYTTITMEQKYYFIKLYINRRWKSFQELDEMRFATPEKAEERAIEYCLEHLI